MNLKDCIKNKLKNKSGPIFGRFNTPHPPPSFFQFRLRPISLNSPTTGSGKQLVRPFSFSVLSQVPHHFFLQVFVFKIKAISLSSALLFQFLVCETTPIFSPPSHALPCFFSPFLLFFMFIQLSCSPSQLT